MQVWYPLLFALVLVAGMVIGTRLKSTAPPVVVESKEEALPREALGNGKIEEIIRYIEAKYVDQIDRDELVQKAIDNILSELDPHSNYFTAEQVKDINSQLDGNFEGIGIEFLVVDDTVVVISALAGGPADKAGILPNDRIVQISDTLVAGENLDLDVVMKLMRGEHNSQVNIGVIRQGTGQYQEFTLTRDKIPVNSVDVSYMVDETTGLIKINRFSATTYEEFMKALEFLVEKKGMKELVIDLRQNPGGYLQQATNILSQLFEDKDKLLVYTQGRSVHRSDYETTGRPYFSVGKIAVLIDEGTASASEILAGAIQDWDRGVIVGRRSFGKGLVQEQYSLRDGSALRLTVARYYTPSGRSIQKAYTGHDEYTDDFEQRLASGELLSADKVAVADTTNYYTARGRHVHGGGGISPEIFIPLDTALVGDAYYELRRWIPEFAYKYQSNITSRLGEFDLAKFKKAATITDADLEQFYAFAAQKGFDKNTRRLTHLNKEIKQLIKARIGKLLFSDEGFYAVYNEEDPFVHQALKALHTPNPLIFAEQKK